VHAAEALLAAEDVPHVEQPCAPPSQSVAASVACRCSVRPPRSWVPLRCCRYAPPDSYLVMNSRSGGRHRQAEGVAKPPLKNAHPFAL